MSTSHTPRPAFASTSGPRSGVKMLVVGEAWGESEETAHRPFAGASGQLLFEMLGEAMPQEFPELHAEATRMFRYGLAWTKPREHWLEATGITLTNVLALRPPGNKMEALCGDKKTVEAEAQALGTGYPYSASSKGKYLLPRYFGELTRLREEIETCQPNLILALGNTASWAILHATNIGSIRGAIAESAPGAPADLSQPSKVLPSYHPAAVLRQWSWRPIVVADLIKSWRESQYPEIRRPARGIHINPTLPELERWLLQMKHCPPRLLSVDIETAFGQITCIGFASRRDAAMVIPIYDRAKPDWAYWPAGQELRVWQIIREVLESPWPKLGQNFIYDLQYLMKLGIRPKNCLEDTMLLHHSHFPEMKKGLGFLASIYSNESSWKLMNVKTKVGVTVLKGLEATLKADQ